MNEINLRVKKRNTGIENPILGKKKNKNKNPAKPYSEWMSKRAFWLATPSNKMPPKIRII